MKHLLYLFALAIVIPAKADSRIEVTLDWLNRDGSRDDGACTQVFTFTPQSTFVIIGRKHAEQLVFLKVSGSWNAGHVVVSLTRQRRVDEKHFADLAEPISADLVTDKQREVIDADFKYLLSGHRLPEQIPNQTQSQAAGGSS